MDEGSRDIDIGRTEPDGQEEAIWCREKISDMLVENESNVTVANSGIESWLLSLMTVEVVKKMDLSLISNQQWKVSIGA